MSLLLPLHLLLLRLLDSPSEMPAQPLYSLVSLPFRGRTRDEERSFAHSGLVFSSKVKRRRARGGGQSLAASSAGSSLLSRRCFFSILHVRDDDGGGEANPVRPPHLCQSFCPSPLCTRPRLSSEPPSPFMRVRRERPCVPDEDTLSQHGKVSMRGEAEGRGYSRLLAARITSGSFPS